MRWRMNSGIRAARSDHCTRSIRNALDYLAQRSALSQRRVLDIGCGGGLLTEALARHGAHVSGIDLAPAMIEVARLHAHESRLQIDYHLCSAAAVRRPGREPRSTSLPAWSCSSTCRARRHCWRAAARLLRPGGDLFVSTINRNLRSFLLAIVGAEYLLRLVPRGTHEYARLLRPAELARLARAHEPDAARCQRTRVQPVQPHRAAHGRRQRELPGAFSARSRGGVIPATPLAAVLLDLDGTLLDTAPDMALALNTLRAEQRLAPLAFQSIRPHVSNGANAVVRVGFPDADAARVRGPARALSASCIAAQLVRRDAVVPGFR